MLQFGCVPSIWTSLETDWSVRPQKFVVKRYMILSEETEGSWTRLLTSPHCRLCDFSSASMTDSCIVKTLERALWSTKELLLKSVELSWVLPVFNEIFHNHDKIFMDVVRLSIAISAIQKLKTACELTEVRKVRFHFIPKMNSVINSGCISLFP